MFNMIQIHASGPWLTHYLKAAIVLWVAAGLSFPAAANAQRAEPQAPPRLLAAPAEVAEAPVTPTRRAPGERRRHPLPPAPVADPAAPVSPVAIDGADIALVKKWGIRIESMRLTAAGYMLDFRYQVVDARKAKPLFERKTKPLLRDEATGAEMQVPVPPKTGALRNSNAPQAGRSYFMFFANPGRFIKAGRLVTVTIGAFRVSGIRVDADPAPKGAAAAVQAQSPGAGHTGHEGHTVPPAATATLTAAAPARLVTPPPVIADIPLIDSGNRATSLGDVLSTDDPVFVNFIFTTCTTICPVMSAGFAQLHDTLGEGRDRVRLVSISIDPETDTVATLRAYAARYRAGASWLFLTGTPASVEAAQRAFGAYRGGKNNHAPATFFRRGRNAPWQTVSGLSSAETLLTLFRGPS